MKTNNILNTIIIITFMFGALFWGGCGTSIDNGPCPEEDWVYDIRHLDHDYDSLFPYDESIKTLTYLYSNDTIKGDTLVFELYKTDTLEITDYSWTGGGGGCTVYADEVKSFYYRLIDENNYSFEFRIQRTKRGLNLELIDPNSYNSTFMKYPSWVYSYEIHHGQINEGKKQTLTIGNKKYFNTINYLSHTLYYCTKDSFEYVEVDYNTVFGFLKLTNHCKSESFQLFN